jgi:D-alanyl-D-alanine carboxypeptidase
MLVSAHAAAQKPTKMYLKPGESINVDNAIRAIVIRSANDVAVVIAESLGGTESHFAQMMTQKAHDLGMRDTNFHNASGLPDPLQITTASDLAILARHLAYDYPQYFPYFGISGFTYRGIYYGTHDNLIGRYDGADGIKTGYTGSSGFNLVSSVVRGGVHIIGVVMGGRTAYRRDTEMVRLLNGAFVQIADNPTLVARVNVPWQNVAQVALAPALAGFNSAPAVPAHGDVIAALAANSEPALHGEVDDEDAAESQHEAGEDLSVIHAEAPPPPPLHLPAPQPRIAVNIPAIRPKARPDLPAAMQIAMVSPAAILPARVARVVPQARPATRPALRSETGEGDIGDAGIPVASIPGRNWTIQIGAYTDQNLARAQLASYAERSMDVLGQAARIVVPFQSVDGHTLFRARFGLFAEREAREVCGRLTQRGQTCFAAIATR